MTVPEWWHIHSNVVELARWLDDRCELASTRAAIDVFEKPWKWVDEYTAMRMSEARDSDLVEQFTGRVNT